MKFEKITDFISEATTIDLLLTLAIIIIVVALVCQIFLIGNYLKKIYTMQKNELKTINTHLAHLDHNNYTSDYVNNK